MNTDEKVAYHIERLKQATKNGDVNLLQALERWKDRPITIAVNGKYLLEGFVNFFQSAQDMLRAVDDTVPYGLPPQCLDPVQIARLFGLPLDQFNCSRISDCDKVEQSPKMLNIGQVARLLDCSYGEARNRMLDGRIRAIKDGRWCRCRKEWVEEYIEKQTVKPNSSQQDILIPVPMRKTGLIVKANGVAHKFLQARQD